MKERREFVERFGGEERPSLEANIDYRRKRGMLEEINRAARDIEKEEAEMDAIRLKDAMDESGPVDLPVGPGSDSMRGLRRQSGAGTAAPPPGSDFGAGRAASAAGAGAGADAEPMRRPTGGKQTDRRAVAGAQARERRQFHAGGDREGARHAASGGGTSGRDPRQARAVTEEEVLQALGKQLGIAYSAELKVDAIDTDLATGSDQLRQAASSPGGGREGEVVMVAMSDPLDMGALDDVRMRSAPRSSRCWCRRSTSWRSSTTSTPASTTGGDLGEKGDEEDEGGSEELVDILEITDEAPDHPLGQLAAVPAPSRSAPAISTSSRASDELHRALPHRRRAPEHVKPPKQSKNSHHLAA